MRLKVYQAPNIGAAMAMVRAELGPDALILTNRVVAGGVEVTAALEDAPALLDPEIAASAPAQTSAPVQILGPPPPLHLSSPLADMARGAALRWHGVPAGLAARLTHGDLVSLLSHEFRFAALPCGRGEPPLLLLGPPGAGKTTTTARLATRLKLAGQDAMVITADGRRAGAAEQLAAFTRLLGLTLIVADEPRQLARAIARRKDNEPVLVDMPGLNPFDPQDQDYVRSCQAAISASMSLVLPAGLDPADAEDTAHGFKELGVTLLVGTRLDQSRRLGGLLAAGHAGLAFTDAGISPGVADGMTKITPAFLAGRLSAARRPDRSCSPTQQAQLSSLALLARTNGEKTRCEP